MNTKQIRTLFLTLMSIQIVFVCGAWGLVTFFDTPSWLLNSAACLWFVLMFFLYISPWGRKLRNSPEERARKMPRTRFYLVLALTLLFCWAWGWIGMEYTTNWKFLDDAAKAKELYRQGDYKSAWPYIRKSFVGKDPEVWYMFAVNTLAAPQGSYAYKDGEDCLRRSAEAGFLPAVALWERHRTNVASPLPERERYLLLLNTAAKNGDRAADNLLRDWAKWTNAQTVEIHHASGVEALRKLGTRTPQCLEGFRCIPLKSALSPQGHGGADRTYALHCPCGGTMFRLGGFRITDMDEAPLRNFLAPLSLQCQKCDKTIPMFDDCRDGYDARLVDDVTRNLQLRKQEKRAAVLLEKGYEIVVSFEYGIADESISPGSDLEKNLPDCFTWISVYGIDAERKAHLLFDWECA